MAPLTPTINLKIFTLWMKKIFLTKLGMCVVSVKANDFHAIWWSDLKTSVLFAGSNNIVLEVYVCSQFYAVVLALPPAHKRKSKLFKFI